MKKTGTSLILGLFGSMLASGALVFGASNAAFTGVTTNGPNSWTTGTVALSDDDLSAAMFNVTGMVPGQTGTKCIKVNYDGNVAANVKLYSSVTGTLGPGLNMVVEQGTGGTFSSCTGFVAAPTTPIYSGTLANMGTVHSNFTNGAGSWAPTATPTGQTRTYRFTYTLPSNTTAQGQTANATFTWEAQNT